MVRPPFAGRPKTGEANLTMADNRTTPRRRLTARLVASACMSAALVAATVPASAGTAAAASPGTITFGQLLPFTGTKAFLSSWATHGDAAAVWDVNNHGGVMGEKLVAASADDGGDAVDAVPALRKLLISPPAFIVGPYSLTIMAVVRDFGPNHVVDFTIGGTTQLDHMRYPYVFRTTASDSAEVVAMAYYAKERGSPRRPSSSTTPPTHKGSSRRWRPLTRRSGA